jgi:hypothetical protein
VGPPGLKTYEVPEYSHEGRISLANAVYLPSCLEGTGANT